MDYERRSIDHSNALAIEEKCYPYSTPIALFESIIDFCNQVLAHIDIRQDNAERDRWRSEQIFRNGVTHYYDEVNDISVFTNTNGGVVTTRYGR